MSPIGSLTSLAGSPLTRIETPQAKPGVGIGLSGPAQGAPSQSFGQMLEGVVSTVETKNQHAHELTRRVLLGETDQLHQSTIAMQEASVAFSMMVEMRNKLVESYQELMRMQV